AGAVVSKEFIANVPVGRNFQAIAQSVPQAAGDAYGVSFQGAQSPESNYILDGMNITDPIYGAAPGTWTGRSAPTLLSNFVQEIDVKTGSFMPEYGRATGGIMNVVTKGGSNEFHGSVFANLRADSLVTPDGKVVGRDGEAIGWYSKPSDGSYNLDVGAEIGGPIMKDKLWFYAGFAPIVQKTYYDRFQRTNVLLNDPGYDAANCRRATSPLNAFGDPDTRCRDADGFALYNKVDGSDASMHTAQTSYQWVGKLSFQIDPDNSLYAATYGQPSTLTTWAPLYAANPNANVDIALNSYDVIGKYTGKFVDKHLVVEVTAGLHNQKIEQQPNAYQSATPLINWNDPNNYYGLSAFETAGSAEAACSADLARCPVRGYLTGGNGFTDSETVNRYAGKASVEYLFTAAGQHRAKLGLDFERNTLDHTKYYSGGYQFQARNGQFRAVRGYGNFNPPQTPTDDRANIFPTPSVTTSSYSNNFAYFLQDSWQVQDINLTLNAGLRLETQKMLETSNPSNYLNTTDSWAPRVQAIWDFTGTGRGKVSGNWGRFYWAIPLDAGDRTFGNESQIQFRAPFSCYPGLPTTTGTRYNPGGQIYANFDPAGLVLPDGKPSCPDAQLTAFNVGYGTFKYNPYGGPTAVQPGLKATSVDMFGAELEYEVISDLSVGFAWSARRQNNIIEDMSPDDGNHFFLGNPGSNVTFDYGGATYSTTDAVMFDSVTGRSLNVKFPKAERSYDGFTVKMTKNLSQNWLATASYTYSVLRGNYAGPFMTDYGAGTGGQGQLDPGITAAFDLPSLLYNTNGYLPNDHPHQIKLAGSYTWPLGTGFSVTGGASYTGQSGRPNTALGGHDLYGAGLAYIIQQGFAGRTPWTNQLDLGAKLSWVFSAPYELRFSFDVFNVLNQQAVLLYDQNYTFDGMQIIQNAGCKGDFVGTSDPIGNIQSACPDMRYLRTVDGRLVGVNPSWGKPAPTNITYQTPIQLRFGLALAF
ncbi:MAG TPA: hypothetical protein VFR85_02745, partial [Anaeromyxobacteraceae bacterium]|nr:hypothetical protein [Anaeromyxobacteraceae bacterium]